MTTAKRKPLSLLLTLLMLVSMVVNLIVPVYAAENVGTIYLVQYPRGGGDTDAWGHPNLTYMNGWQPEAWIPTPVSLCTVSSPVSTKTAVTS